MKRWVLAPISWIVLLSVITTFAFAKDEFFDEIFDEKGQVLEHYREVYEQWQSMTGSERERFLEESKKAFAGDNALDPMPRVIPGEEYDNVLKKGVDQRARALRAFLQDHYSGARRYSKEAIVPAAVVERIIRRSGESAHQGRIGGDVISFMYGPDIIRDAKGNWRVIEDNPGFIGGVGDLKLAQEFLTKNMPVVERALKFRKSDAFYENIATRFKERAAKHGGKVVLYMVSPYPDNEDKRIRQLMAQHGIELITNNSKLQMKVMPDGVYSYDSSDPKTKYEKIGFVMFNGEHSWLDPHDPANFERLVLEEAKGQVADPDLDKEIRKILEQELQQPKRPDLRVIRDALERSNIQSSIKDTLVKAQQARGLTQAILDRKVDANYSPGVDFIGDKEFYVYVEDLIRFYLKEEPILKNIPTKRFAKGDTNRLDERIFEKVFSDPSRFVIKKVDGRGGDAVWVGPKIKHQELAGLKARIRRNPSEYIVQAYTPLSRMNENIVDIRVIADVGPKSIYVTDTPWGRGLPADGNGKVNLSDQGREITVLVRDGTWGMCRQLFFRK